MTGFRYVAACAVAAAFVAVFAAAGASGAPRPTVAPANDDFANAEPLTTRFGFLGAVNEEATREPGEPFHAGNSGGASVWYTWTASHQGPVTFQTCDSDFDTVLAVYAGDELTALEHVASDDNGCEYGSGSRVAFVSVANETYRIAVDGVDGVTGFFPLVWALAPTNDDFVNAVEITGDSGFATGDNFGAAREEGEPEHGAPGGSSVWYRWTAPSSGPATFDLCDSDFDTLLAVYTGPSVSGLTQVAANDQGCGDASRVSFQASGGTTYSIAVDGYYGSTGNLALSYSRAAVAPENLVPPSVVGTALDGATLSSAVGEWSGTPPFTFGFQWYRCSFGGSGCVSVTGATAAVYSLTSADVGSRLRVAVTASNAGGAATEISDASGIVSALAPANLVPPAISGDPVVGEDLTTDEGRWSGTHPQSHTITWLRCDPDGGACIEIEGTTSSLYTVRSEDVNATIRVSVTSSNSAGSAHAVSEPTRRVVRRQPARPTCLVPRLKGKLLKVARQAIRRANCSVGRVRSVRSRRARGRVLSQNPRPGVRRPRGTRVNLVVSRGGRR